MTPNISLMLTRLAGEKAAGAWPAELRENGWERCPSRRAA